MTAIDLPRGAAQPRLARFVAATLVAVGGSLLVCAVLAALAEAVDPALRTYEHFRFADYAKLTILGVVISCLAWPVVTWFASRARGLFLVLALLVTVAGLAPDAWILVQGQPPVGVLTLAFMHVGLLVVTYPALVLIAPQQSVATRGATAATA